MTITEELDKELLIQAVNQFDIIPKSQKALLILVIEFSKGEIANIPIKSISELSGFSKTIIYKSLTRLEQLQFIKREKVPQEKIGYIKLNLPALQEILRFYMKKQQYLPKKFTNKKNNS